MMRKIFIIFLALGISTICFAGSNVGDENVAAQTNSLDKMVINVLNGSWKITTYVWEGMSSSAEKHPEKLIGTELFFGTDHAQLVEGFCKSPKYNFHHVDDINYYLTHECGIRPKNLGLDNEKDLNVVEIECAGKNNLSGSSIRADIFVINQNLIIYRTDGPFFLLHKKK